MIPTLGDSKSRGHENPSVDVNRNLKQMIMTWRLVL